ncbi:unnamed protein product [Penicillium nalgiovense]|nr:unnamed protein product [Penicillium nalgiovense]
MASIVGNRRIIFMACCIKEGLRRQSTTHNWSASRICQFRSHPSHLILILFSIGSLPRSYETPSPKLTPGEVLHTHTKRTKMAYNLSIEVFGPGDSPTHRSHWGFMINKPGNLEFGDLLQVEIIDSDRLWYGFAPRYATKIIDKAAVGMCKIADLTSQQRHDAIRVIEKEPAPRDSIGRCQDWTFDALLSLEIEELVPSGTSAFWKGMIGRPAREVAAACGTQWTAFA